MQQSKKYRIFFWNVVVEVVKPQYLSKNTFHWGSIPPHFVSGKAPAESLKSFITLEK